MAKKSAPKGGVTFGRKLLHTSTRKLAYSVSDDAKAFEIRFETALAAGVGTPGFDGVRPHKAPMNARTYTAVIPATGKSAKFKLALNGFGMTEAGTSTLLLLTANGQHIVKQFAPRPEGDFTATLPFEAKAVTEIRITLTLIAERDASHPGATALVAVTDISADTAL